jgi:hypothetical protein
MGTVHTVPAADDLADLIRQLRRLPPKARAAVQRLLDGNDPADARERFLPFVRRVWPEFIHGRIRGSSPNGCFPRYQAGNNTEANFDFVCREGRLMMQRLSSPCFAISWSRPSTRMAKISELMSYGSLNR